VHGAQRRSRTASSPPEGFILDRSEHRATLVLGRARFHHLLNVEDPREGSSSAWIETTQSAQPSICEAEPDRASRGAPKSKSRIDGKRKTQKVIFAKIAKLIVSNFWRSANFRALNRERRATLTDVMQSNFGGLDSAPKFGWHLRSTYSIRHAHHMRSPNEATNRLHGNAGGEERTKGHHEFKSSGRRSWAR
jgi:hypothetical protein